LGPALALALAWVVARAVIAAAIFGNRKIEIFLRFMRRTLEETRILRKLTWVIDGYEGILSGFTTGATIYVSTIAVASLVIALGFLVFVVYPQVPQELGGFKTRCAHLELDTAKVSAEALNQFFPNEGDPPLSGVERTGKVDVLFDKGGVLLIRPQTKDTNGDTPRVYQMRGDSVQSVVGCSNNTKTITESEEPISRFTPRRILSLL
jgi:hypothetical protein